MFYCFLILFVLFRNYNLLKEGLNIIFAWFILLFVIVYIKLKILVGYYIIFIKIKNFIMAKYKTKIT